MRPLPPVKSPNQTPVAPMSMAGGMNNTDPETQTSASEVVDGQNMFLDRKGGAYNRKGVTWYNNFIGTTTGILGHWNYTNKAATQSDLLVYDTGVYYDNGGVYTALTGVTMTTNLRAEGAYFPYNDKFYILNGTDNVVKYTTGGSGDQTDAAFKKGTGITVFADRLIIWGVSGQENYGWVSDAGTDTFSANSYFRVEGKIQKCVALNYNLLLIVTDRGVSKISAFTGTLDGTASTVPASIYRVGMTEGSLSYGTPAGRSVVLINGLVYYLSLDSQNTVEVMMCDGQSIHPIGNQKIKNYLQGINSTYIQNACAIKDGFNYRFAVTPTGATTNTREYLFDTRLTNPSSVTYAPESYTLPGAWHPEFRPGFPISCYCEIKVSGATVILAGHQSYGLVYRMNQAVYDELIDQSSFDAQNSGEAITGLTAVRAAQSFKLSTAIGQTQYVTGGAALMKKNGGTTTGLTVRIETDSGGKPSGTLADANLTTTIAAFTGISYAYQKFSFSTPATLAGNTTYHLVIQHTTEGSGTSDYRWGSNTAGTYANGNVCNYTAGSWARATAVDAIFALFIEQSIESWVTQTTNHGFPIFRKKAQIIAVEGQSSQGIIAQLGIGTEGKDSDFTSNPISLFLNGKGSKWSSSSSDVSTGHLVWGTGQWASTVAAYSLSVFNTPYQTPARYLSYRFYFNGVGDFRINAYTPTVEVIPTAL